MPFMPRRDPTAYPPELESSEAALIASRRAATGLYPPTNAATASQLPSDAIGFGLSGGGIRSATFCLGLFQAIAEKQLLGRIDFLSTVSGGGYFGSFLGRVFSRDWITGVADAEHVLRAKDGPEVPEKRIGWAGRTFRWLRDNGRYLAPRGSGDLIVLGAILLRNWIAVQSVMITSVLAVFVALQLLRGSFDAMVGLTTADSALGQFLCTLPGGNGLFLWSPWLLLLVPVLVLLAVPAGWAYWLVTRRVSDGPSRVSPVLGAILALAVSVAGMIRYRLSAGATAITDRLPDPGSPWVSQVAHPVRFWLAFLITMTAVTTMVYWLVCQLRIDKNVSPLEVGNFLRNRLTFYLKNGVLLCALILGWTVVDTLGATLYAVAPAGQLARWGASLFAVFAGLGAFARTAAVLVAPTQHKGRPAIPFSILSWIMALVVVSTWLVSLNVVSHAVAWQFKSMNGVPAGFTTPVTPTLLGVDRVQVTTSPSGYEITAAKDMPVCSVPAIVRPAPRLSVAIFLLLVALTWLFGQTTTFANMSSLHTFYASRLTRTFLGASNPNRLGGNTAIKEAVSNDDCSGDEYWQWPAVDSAGPSTGAIRPWTRGAPLHIVNTTVNETMDTRMKVQNQDRKGTGLALGPCGLSLGIRHHLVSNANGEPAIFPRKSFAVFRSRAEGGRTPEPLSLGHWMSVSGAAFSAAAGANTTVPVAILAGMFNIRLGYWWDSGTPSLVARWRCWDKQWTPWLALEGLLPVQAALLAEILARTRGTAGQWWNLSDGGHFENMGGYELIRRRLPVIVIVDAEADPDYTFQGLSDLVRKARLDFNAEIMFLTGAEVSAQLGNDLADHKGLRRYFGDLGALRRGRWSDETVPAVDGTEKRFILEVDRSSASRAHAALAKVEYLDTGETSWLVYIKATLMGDEPEDVCHYHRAHPEFPQETTNDQFFDEAQWESYRRLGLHIGHRVLRPELFERLKTPPLS